MPHIRNIAIIAHVDHGKTTLVDNMIDVCKLFAGHQEKGQLVMDSHELEKERGITIRSKNIAVRYKGVKINITDTPGHADFGGEVERVLKMADGVLLLVDAFEGIMPQTRFVLQKALSLSLIPIVVINKLDKQNCKPEEVVEAIFDLMCELDATEQQLNFTTLYGSSKQGWMSTNPEKITQDITPLLDTIIEKIPPPAPKKGIPQFQITSLAHSTFAGRIAIGRMYQGTIQQGKTMGLCKANGTIQKVKVKEIHVFEGLGKEKVTSVSAGDICTFTGLEGFDIGDTLTDLDNPMPLPRIAIDEPTMRMLFTVNNSPFAGQEGQFLTARHLRDRLMKEVERDLALRVTNADTEDKFLVAGRGILHLSILIETMRREKYEFQVGQAQVILKEIDGVQCEPIEKLIIDVPDVHAGKVITLTAQRKAKLLIMESREGQQHFEFDIPARGLIGLRSNILTASAGEAVMNHCFQRYEPHKGAIPTRVNGALIAMDTGPSTAYAIDKLQDRGVFFITPGTQVYAGQVIGEHVRPNDLLVNVQKGKKLTNMRAASADQNVKITPPKQFSLEEAMEYIKRNEYLEITPNHVRIRKIHLNEKESKK